MASKTPLTDKAILMLLHENPMSRYKLDLLMHIVIYTNPEIKKELDKVQKEESK